MFEGTNRGPDNIHCTSGVRGCGVQVTERYPLTGEVREFRRRDLRRGTLPGMLGTC